MRAYIGKQDLQGIIDDGATLDHHLDLSTLDEYQLI